jgi:hypothetical protein
MGSISIESMGFFFELLIHRKLHYHKNYFCIIIKIHIYIDIHIYMVYICIYVYMKPIYLTDNYLMRGQELSS